MKFRRYLPVIAISILFGVIFFLAKTKVATAAVTTRLPAIGTSDFIEWNSTTQINDVYLSVAVPGTNYKLDAPVSRVKLYIKKVAGRTTARVRIRNAAWCPVNTAPAGANIDSLSTNGYANTVFEVHGTTTSSGNEAYGTTIAYTGTDILNCSVSVDGTDDEYYQRDPLFIINLSSLKESTVAGHQGWYVAYINARNNGAWTDAINGFRVESEGTDRLSYYAGAGSKFSLGQMWLGPPPTIAPANRWGDFTLPFAAPCSVKAGQTVTGTLRWYDADAGQSNQISPTTGSPNTIGTYITEISPTGVRNNVDLFSLTGGNDVDGSHTFTMKGGGYTYEWHLENVYSRNGLQFQLPFDSFNTIQDCSSYNMVATFDPPPADLSVPPGTNMTINLKLQNLGNENSGIDCGVSGTAGGCVFVRFTDNSTIGNYLDLPARTVGGGPNLNGCQSIVSPEPAASGFAVYKLGSGVAFCNNTAEPNSGAGNVLNWRFNYNAVPGGATDAASFDIRVKSTAPNGSFCMNAYVYKRTPTSITTDANSYTDQLCITISNPKKPYSRVYGGDVIAGMPQGCQGWTEDDNLTSFSNFTSAHIYGFTSGSGTSFKGSGAQLAAQALGGIYSFTTASTRTSDPKLPKGLAFSGPPGAYGGFFGGTPPCPADYYSQHTGGAPSGALATNASGVYESAVNLSISGDVANGKKLVIFVNGDLQITGNTTLNIANTAWSSVGNIPSLWVIVRGNIYIQPNVTQVDGVYIAQPKDPQSINLDDPAATGGFIYTCANGAAAPTEPMLTSTAAGGCGRKLSINGSLTALGLRLYRTNGDISTQAINNETAAQARADVNIAEVFQFTPEFWLAGCNAGLNLCAQPGVPSIYSLPPVL